ncbi:ubiquitin carboxyl-terminal hydrolase 47-like isoform X2 [Zootermopsis nevadensis]|uniref:ubiquitin carboxyl-terminal hydrolase 47-like isoform X2 n=1 Tax=Zootermopsis nevadensis TaxID=136037 RepID=UPI000B8EC80A|nr:ubiquitin carboxyl-terminal hydrolase 47-like isoform X2 [Zootermopsis nevadensis]
MGMVCVLEEGEALCIIQDLTSATTGTKRKLLLPVSSTVQELFQEVGQIFHYDPENFELILDCTSDGQSIILNEHKEKTISAVGVNCDSGARNTFIITDMPTAPRRKVVPVSGDGEDDMLLGASASPTAAADYAHPPPAPPPPPPVVSSGDCSYAAALIKHDTGYVGLVNQAMTCYLNSLLQALYMTPEFRNALYKWEFDGTDAEAVKSIPYQLQKLFLNLQTSSKSAVETTELTRSFGWDSSEAWQQHDIQELCRVMFDALEQKFKHTDQADLIQRLYEGKMIDYVKCLECGTEKSREDTFLDIPLPVRPFGSAVAYGSVEEALRAFVQPETLDGNNQYHCEKCNKKCDAHKGLKFSKFPYLLTLHLKRFDFDYTTLHRIKLNDKVAFPEILNLNSVVACAGNRDESDGVPEESVVKCDDSSTTDSGSALDDESCQGTETVLSTQDADYQEDDEGIDMSNGPNHHENEKNRRHTMEKGPYMYELFSIMIHSGSASGGHYYAYIKEFKKGDWFCFNDQSVNRITYDDITKTYGGGPMRGYYSGAYSSSTNAYMLMYRQIDKERNCEAMSVDEFPSHIKDLLQKIQKREENERILWEKEMDMCKIKLYAHHPTQNQVVESKLCCLSNVTLQEAAELAHKKLHLEGVVPIERCRLVNYDRLQDTIECSFEGREDDSVGDILNGLRGNSKYDFLLEIRKDGAEFETYQLGGISAKVFVVDLEAEEVDGPTIVRGNILQTVAEFKVTLAKALQLDAKTLKIVLEKYRYSNEPRLLDNDEITLKFEGFYKSNKIFVASRYDDDPEKSFVISKLRKIIDRFEHIVCLRMVLPDTDKETLEKLAIPVLNLDVNHNGSGNCKLLEDSSTNEEATGADGASALGVSSPANTGSTLRDSSPQPPGDAEDEGIGATGHSDQSASEDSSLTDSDRTLVGDVPDECLAQLSSPSNSPAGSDQHNVSSPEEGNTNTYHSFTREPTAMWDDDEKETAGATTKSTAYYFRAVPYIDDDNQRMLKVLVDKRMFLGTLKKDLEPYVGVPVEYFKIYRLYSGQQEFECARFKESLGSYHDDDKLIIRLGRALKKGEHRGKVYQLLPNASEPSKFLCDWILGKGMKVGEMKKEILQEIKRKYSIDIPYDRCRLRKKSWKNPAKIYLDHQQFEDIGLFPNWEMFLQELPEPEKVTSNDQLVLFVRHWCPAELELKPLQEVVFDGSSVEELKTKLSDFSGIPIEYLEFAKGQGSFPCEVSVLILHTELDWSFQSSSLDTWPLLSLEDGQVIFYRDRREELKQPSSQDLKDIANKEGSRVNRFGSTLSAYSPRKERALKIYLDASPRRCDDVDVD